MIYFMSIHALFRIYCHYHHYNILYQNIITAKISREHRSCDQLLRVGFTLFDLFPDITDRISSIEWDNDC